METRRHSSRTASPANDPGQLSHTTSPRTSHHSNGRQPVISGKAMLSASNSPLPEDPKNNGKQVGMKGGMSQFRAQPVFSKQKLRVKQYDPTRRNYIARNDDEGEKKDRSGMTEPNGHLDGLESFQERRPGQQQVVSPGVDDTGDTMPHSGSVVSPARSGATLSMDTAEDFTPERLAGIVSFSITKCREKHMTTLGLAIKRLCQESHEDSRLANILGSVLSQTATDEDKTELQQRLATYKQRAKAEIAEHKAKNSVRAPSSNSDESKTPSQADSPPDDNTKANVKSPARRTRASARKSTTASIRNMDEDEPEKQTPVANGKRSRAQASIAGESRSKRQKRSGSVSSGSSLSSIPTDAEQDVDMSDTQKATRSSSKKIVALQLAKQDPKFKGPPKKLPGILDPPRINGKIISTADEPSSIARKQKKQELTRKFDHVKVNGSSLRSPLQPLAFRPGSEDMFPNLSITSADSRKKKKDLDDLESVASSAQDELLVPPPAEARRSSRSRQATPNAQRFRGPSARVQARVKISPQKKGSGVAGVPPRSSRSKEISVELSDDDEEKDNNDFCSACGASGRLLCCDGCIRAFHFMCLDPPMAEDAPPEGLWFCFNCEAKKDPYHRARRGLFSLLKVNIRKANTSAYSLPKHTRDYYEGVGTGDDGEYIDVPSSGKTKNVKVPGYDEEKKQDNTKLTNKKGEAILCFACGGSALGKREIIACDYCGLYWHLDCMNPPMANPPFRDPQNRAKYRWMCPAHADSVVNAAGPGGRLYKTRRPRNARVIDTQLRRGFKSNGIVEIELDDSAEESEIDDEPPIFRVTEKSIRLDFNDRLRRDKEESLRRQAVLRRLQAENNQNPQDSIQAFRAKSLIEKQAVASLVELTQASTSPALQPDEIKEVIDALLLEAPTNVLALLDSQPAGGQPIGESLLSGQKTAPKELEARQLILLRELIGEKLARLGHLS